MGDQTTAVSIDQTKTTDGTTSLDGLVSALKRLDLLLEGAVARAQVVYGSKVSVDPYRGLYINQEEAGRLLSREPCEPALWTDGTSPVMTDNVSRLAWLRQAFSLSSFDMDVILIALAPELDLRYERLYAYLQDDVTRKRPTVELVLNLLCPSAEQKLTRRIHFSASAPLIRESLLHLIPDANQHQPPLLAHYLKLDEQIIRLLLGQESLDQRLAPFCQMIEPAVSLKELPLNFEAKQALPVLVARAREAGQPLRLYFHGPAGGGKRRTAEALAGEMGTRLLVADIARSLSAKTEFAKLVKLLHREAWFQDAILYLDGLQTLRHDERASQFELLLDALAENNGITILAGQEPWNSSGRHPLGVLRVSFPIPEFSDRQHHWHASLIKAGITPDGYDLDGLAGRFRLTPGQITEAVATAYNQARYRSATRSAGSNSRLHDQSPNITDLYAAARAQSGHDLARLAHKITPSYTWDDIVLPEDALAQLRELCQRVTNRPRVLGEWGFDAKLSLGKGINALFAGPSGTGKTMAAEIIASELGVDLYKIELSGVVSKYIGETEKNLDRVFRTAENANAILFFDEADALFGKRSEVRDSHDRYANIEISYLLQKMEQYDGIAILATNLRGNLDEAFTRRLAFIAHFPFPDEVSRRRIWAGIWPADTPLAGDVDLDFLAHQFKLSGGNIKNTALAAAFLAAEDTAPVSMTHLLQATRREYQKMGKQLSEAELTGTPEETQTVARIIR